mgnify:CR=1 FL=1
MKVIVIGPRGKMGKLITQVAASRDDMKLVAGIAPKGRDYIGMDLGTVAMTGSELGVPVTDDLAGVIDSCDVIIDFSTKEMAMEVLDLAIAHKKALVCGSTGFSAEEMKRFEDAGKQIPMLYAANTSKLVNIMNKLLELGHFHTKNGTVDTFYRAASPLFAQQFSIIIVQTPALRSFFLSSSSFISSF